MKRYTSFRDSLLSIHMNVLTAIACSQTYLIQHAAYIYTYIITYRLSFSHRPVVCLGGVGYHRKSVQESNTRLHHENRGIALLKQLEFVAFHTHRIHTIGVHSLSKDPRVHATGRPSRLIAFRS